METIDRSTAIDLGLTRYFTGKPCKHGHTAQRKVENGACVECARLITRRWRGNGSKAKESFNPCGKTLPEQDYLKECFDYVFSTGELIWRNRPPHHFKRKGYHLTFNKKYAGKVAGHYHSRNGYLEIRLDNKLYKGHRIIWKLLTGEDPENMLDHISGDVSDNRIENLRVASARENARNASKRVGGGISRYKGVTLVKGKWVSRLTINDTRYDAVCESEIEAALDYDKRAREVFGEFARLNFPELSHE